MNKIDESNGPVFYGLRGTTRKQYLLDLGRPSIEPQPEFDALLYQIFLTIGKHGPDHLPRDVNEPIFDEMVCHIGVFLADRNLKSQLIQFKSVKAVVSCQPMKTLPILEDDLDLGGRHRHMVRHLQDHLVHVLIVVPNTEVGIQKSLVRILLKIGWQGLHLFMRKRNLEARLILILLLQEVTEISNPLISLILFTELLYSLLDPLLLLGVE